MNIGLNIGHFGTKGAIGYLDEVVLNNEVYNALKPKLEAAGHTVVSCNDATPKDYVSATKVANQYNLDLLISIHFNSSDKPSATGTEVLYLKGSSKGKEYAEKLSKAISSELGVQNRGAKTTNVHIVDNSKAPCVLIEPLFVSNKSDCEKYSAEKISDAVAECFGYRKWDKKIETGNDIIWELMNGKHKIEITDVPRAVKAVDKAKYNADFSSLYWILYKLINGNN